MKSHRLRTIGVLAAGLLALFVVTGVTNADPGPAFAPTISLETSTTRAAAHPDARITVDMNGSTEDMEQVTIDLPDGMMGSLNAAEPCPSAVALAENCGDGSHESSKIGTVTNYATVDESDVVLHGKVYLTEALPGNDDPAGMQIVVPAVIGGVDMGNVVVNARVQLNRAPMSSAWSGPTENVGAVVGVRTIVDEVPNSITDSHGRTATFNLQKLVVDLRSNQQSPYSKLLTNSSRCDTSQMPTQPQIAMEAKSYDDSTATDSEQYSVTQCDDVHVADLESSTFTPTASSAGSDFAFTSTMEFGDDQPAVDSIQLQMAPIITFVGAKLGTPLQQCPNAAGGTVVDFGDFGDFNSFTSADCPDEAHVGKVKIETPLLKDPIFGDLYLIESSPTMTIGIYVDPTTDDDQPLVDQNNPAGVSFGVASNGAYTKNLANGCSGGICRNALTIDLVGLPNIPLKKVTVIGDPGERAGNPLLTGDFMHFGPAGDLNCQPNNEVTTSFTSWVGSAWDEDAGGYVSDRGGSGVASFALSGCNPRNATLAGAPYGGFAADDSPTLAYADATAATAGCGVDTQTSLSNCDPVGGIGGGNTYAASGLAPGIHHFFTRVNRTSGQFNWRTFAVPNEAPTDATAPEVTLSNEPGATTADTTPSVDFTSDESAYFQCSLDGGPFLPCSDPNTPATSGSYTVPSALIASDDTHEIEVRAQDAAGNTSAVESTSFQVVVPLDPGLDIDVSTSVARAHPTLDLTVDSGSHEDIKNLTLAMPDGFMGSINAVQSLCSIATAEAGNCTAASEVGTVDTEAVVDESTVRISGKVYMTDPIAPGDPAGLMVDVPAKIQDVDMGHVLVPVRLAVRGEAKGLDSFATNLPQGIDPADWGNSFDSETFFDLRSITLKLRNNPLGSQPLLTNPSDCSAMEFAASFTGYNDTMVSKSVPFAATGCGALAFNPQMNFTQKDSDTGGVPAESSPARRVNVEFTANLSSNPDDAGIKSADILLPRPLTADVANLPAPCTQAQADAKACPESSKLGTAVANSPLLDAPISGNVYSLKSDTAIPRLLVALRGRINVDFIANNSFDYRNGDPQVRTVFTDLPDAPLTSFSMNVNRFLRTRDDACDTPPTAWSIIGTMGAHNGSASAINIPLSFDCPSAFGPTSAAAKFSGKGGKFALSSSVSSQTGKKIKKLTVKLPSGVKFNKKNTTAKKIAKYVSIKADGKTLKAKSKGKICFKTKGSNTLEVNFCGKQVKSVSFSFKKGSLKATKRFTKKHPPKLKVTIVDSDNKKHTAKVAQ